MNRKILLLILLFCKVIFAIDIDITYSIESDCTYHPTYGIFNNLLPDKKYKFIFKSKYPIFKKYNLLNENKEYNNDLVHIETNLYTIKPIKIVGKSKSIIQVIVSEDDFKNILKSKELKVAFDEILFSDKTFNEIIFQANLFVGDNSKYTIIFYPNYNHSLQYYIDECHENYKQTLSEYEQKEAYKKRKKTINAIISFIIVSIFLILIIITIIKLTKKTKENIVTKVDEIKEEKRKNEIKTLIENETIKSTIKKSFDFSEKSNINEIQEAIGEALKRNEITEAQKLMDLLKKMTDKNK